VLSVELDGLGAEVGEGDWTFDMLALGVVAGTVVVVKVVGRGGREIKGVVVGAGAEGVDTDGAGTDGAGTDGAGTDGNGEADGVGTGAGRECAGTDGIGFDGTG